MKGPGAEAELRISAACNAAAPTPLLVTADLEGSRMSLAGQTEVPKPLALAAIDDLEVTAEISRIMAQMIARQILPSIQKEGSHDSDA